MIARSTGARMGEIAVLEAEDVVEVEVEIPGWKAA